MKKPPNMPKTGDRVTLRGRNKSGTLVRVNDATLWAEVSWDKDGPKICHMHELERGLI